MEGLRYLVAVLSALAVAVAVHGWLRRQSMSAVAGTPPTDTHAVVLGKQTPQIPGWVLHSVVLVASAIALAWVHRASSWFAFSQSLLLLYLLYPLAVLDWLTLEVELRLVLVGLLLRIAGLLAFARGETPEAVLGMLAGAGMITLAALAYRAVRGRVGLGEGDAAVLAIAGAYLGWTGLVPVLLFAASAGLLVGLAVLLSQRKPLDTPIPFVPFLCIATLVVYVAQQLGWTGLG